MAGGPPPSVPRLELYLLEPTSEGVQRLREILTRCTYAAVGLRVGVTGEAVRQWAREESRPSRRQRARLLAVLGIPVEAWEQAPRWPA